LEEAIMTVERQSTGFLSAGAFSFDARDLLAIGFRHQRLIVLTFLVIFAVGAAVALSLPRVYEPEMKILVKQERADPIVTSEDRPTFQTNLGVTEQEINSEMELLRSRDLHEKVVVATGLHMRKDDSFSAWLKTQLNIASEEGMDANIQIAQAALDLQRSLTIEPLAKSHLIRVAYRSSDPQLAAEVTNTLGELYLAKHLAVHRPVGAFGFFEQETARYRRELETIQAQLVDHERREGVVSVQVERDTALRQLTDFEAILEKTRVEISEVQGRIRALEAQVAVTPERKTTAIRETSSDPQGHQRNTLLGLELKRVELLQVFQPNYPPVQELEKQIAATKNAIAETESNPVVERTTDRDATHEWLTTELARNRAELPVLQARAAGMEQSIREFQEKTRRLEQIQVVQDNLMRDAKLAEENYLTYSRKQEEARISNELDSQRIVNVAIAETATVPFEPAGLGRSLILLLALVLASIGSLGVALVVDFFDPAFRTPDEVEALLGSPVVAALPVRGR
jgi:uncharacterized protein involved in exopolysaccharide biosynthesis